MKYIVAIVVAASAALALPAPAQMKPPVPMTAQQLAHSVPGAPVQLAVRVTARARDVLHADILERRDDSHYRRSGATVELYFPAQTPVVMGSDADVKMGAVLFVFGIATTRGRADVKKVTVITQYVTVE